MYKFRTLPNGRVIVRREGESWATFEVVQHPYGHEGVFVSDEDVARGELHPRVVSLSTEGFRNDAERKEALELARRLDKIGFRGGRRVEATRQQIAAARRRVEEKLGRCIDWDKESQ